MRSPKSPYLDVTTLLPWAGRFYVFRVALVGVTLAMLGVDAWLCSNFSNFHYALMAVGLLYPHFFQWILGRFNTRQRRGRISLVFDGLFAGLIIAALEFGAVPAVVLSVINLFNWMALGGPGLTMLGLTALGLGVGLAGNWTGFSFSLSSCGPVATVSYLMLLGYIILVAAVVYRYSAALRGYCHELLADKDVAVRDRVRADQALLAILPRSVAHELSRDHMVTERVLDDATVVRIEILFPRLERDQMASLADLGEATTICDDIFSRHGFESIKTFGRYYLACASRPLAPDEAVLACREVATFLKCQSALARGGVSHAASMRAIVHCGTAVAGMVQADKLNFDVLGPVVDHISAVPQDLLDAHGIVVSASVRQRLSRNWSWRTVAIVDGMQWYALEDAGVSQ